MIEARGVHVRADGRTLLSNVSFRLAQGEFTAVVGPNGAGKTTLLRAIAALRIPDAGEILIDGRSVAAMHSMQRALALSYLAADEVFVEHLRVRDVVSMGRYAHHKWWEWREEAGDQEAVTRALNAVGLPEFAERSFVTLSSGERQRVWLAMALAQEANVLLLDEPTSHLDVRVAHDILQLLQTQVQSGKTVVCVLHDLNEAAQYADRILLLSVGRILANGSPESVLSGPAPEEAYGIAMERTRTSTGRLRVFAAEGPAARS